MNTERPSTWHLVENIQNGHDVTQSWAELWRTYHHTIYRYMRVHLKGDPHQAEDLTSEVFTRAIARIHTVTWQNRDIGAWLMRIATNLAADHYKRAYTQRVTLNPDMARSPTLAPRLIDQHPDPEEQTVDQQQLDALQRIVGHLLEGLTVRQREVLRLRFWGEMSGADVGTAMGISAGAVKSTQWRAMEVLRKRLEQLREEASQ